MRAKTFRITDAGVVPHIIEFIRNLDLSVVWEVTIKRYKKNRTLAQNKLLHMWCSDTSRDMWEATGTPTDSKKWKWYFKHNFLGYEAIEVNGTISKELRHTSELKVKEFSDFLERIDAHATVDLGVDLRYPADVYQEAMGRHKERANNGTGND